MKIYIYIYIYIFMNDVRKPLYQMCEIHHPPRASPPPKWKVGFLVLLFFFFWHPGFELPPTKSSYPPKNWGLGVVVTQKSWKPRVHFFEEHVIPRPAFVRLKGINPEKKKHQVSKSFEKPLILPQILRGILWFLHCCSGFLEN